MEATVTAQAEAVNRKQKGRSPPASGERFYLITVPKVWIVKHLDLQEPSGCFA